MERKSEGESSWNIGAFDYPVTTVVKYIDNDLHHTFTRRTTLIISASRRTDIPAFYSDWFMSRVACGSFIKTNPFNPRQQKEVSLLQKDVDVIVFWSKNPAPIFQYLPVLDTQGYRYYFQYTLNDYSAPPLGSFFEPEVPPLSSRTGAFKKLSDLIGPEKVIWRYDPIIISNLTPVERHIEKFGRLAEELKGFTRRVIISFLDLYPKIQPGLMKLKKEHNLQVIDIAAPEHTDALYSLARGLGAVATNSGLAIYSCAEKTNLEEYCIRQGSCIDAVLINKIFDLNLKIKKDKSQRQECLCAESVDMGTYNTCKFCCSYCYANRNSMKHTMV